MDPRLSLWVGCRTIDMEANYELPAFLRDLEDDEENYMKEIVVGPDTYQFIYAGEECDGFGVEFYRVDWNDNGAEIGLIALSDEANAIRARVAAQFKEWNIPGTVATRIALDIS